MCFAICAIYYALYIHDTTRYIIQFANDMFFFLRDDSMMIFFTAYEMPM